MKTKNFLWAGLFAAMMVTGLSCTPQKDDKQSGTIDSSVVGKDTNSTDLRRDIDLSDENKRVLPDEATEPTKSDEGARPEK